jgi:hypothetical protein
MQAVTLAAEAQKQVATALIKISGNGAFAPGPPTLQVSFE